MTDTGWFKVAVDIPAKVEEHLLSMISADLPGGAEVLGDEARPLHPELSDLPTGWVRFGVYGQEDDLDRLHGLLDGALAELKSEGRVTEAARRVADVMIPDGWRDRWKSFFHVTRVTPRVVIRPTWESFIPHPDDCVLDLDPGAAFGTGGHATTRLCLNTLDGLLPCSTLLDVGTGSGVLAIAAAKLGVSKVVAVDNDDTAVEVAQENVAMNSVWDRVRVSSDPLERIEGTFDLVIANIIAPVLFRLSDDLAAKVKPGGHLILSGILVEETNAMAASFRDLGLQERGRTVENGWSCLHLEHPID